MPETDVPAHPPRRHGADPGPTRRRALPRSLLLGSLAVVAVAAAAVAVIVYDSLSPPALHAPTDADGVPTALPGGGDLPEVPPRVAQAVDGPVVAVDVDDRALADLHACANQVEWEFTPTLRTAVITPEGMTTSIRGEERGTEVLLHVTCYAIWSGHGWQSWASWSGEAADTAAPLGPPEPICCRDDGVSVMSVETLAPDGAAWLLQDRGPYWLAYPVGDGGLVHAVWPVSGDDRQPPPSVFVDAAGQRIEPPAGANDVSS